jgi:hypothetical protein
MEFTNLNIGDEVKIYSCTGVHPELHEDAVGRIVEEIDDDGQYRIDFWFTRKKLPRQAIKEVIKKNDKEVFNAEFKEKEEPLEIPLVQNLNDEEVEELFGEEIIKEVEDKVNHPKHYNHSKFETIDVIREWGGKDQYEGFCWGNVIKYCSRYKHKNGLEDLKKAKWYLEKLIESKANE